jgi:hypothetical protein
VHAHGGNGYVFAFSKCIEKRSEFTEYIGAKVVEHVVAEELWVWDWGAVAKGVLEVSEEGFGCVDSVGKVVVVFEVQSGIVISRERDKWHKGCEAGKERGMVSSNVGKFRAEGNEAVTSGAMEEVE